MLFRTTWITFILVELGGARVKMPYYWDYKIEDCASAADPRPFGDGVLLVVQFQLLQLHPLFFVTGAMVLRFLFRFSGGKKRNGDETKDLKNPGGCGV